MVSGTTIISYGLGVVAWSVYWITHGSYILLVTSLVLFAVAVLSHVRAVTSRRPGVAK